VSPEYLFGTFCGVIKQRITLLAAPPWR